jgi:hypothetical protein
LQRPDLGDVSQGKLISLTNFFEMFNGILTPRQLEGLRLLVKPFMIQLVPLGDFPLERVVLLQLWSTPLLERFPSPRLLALHSGVLGDVV